MYLNLPLLLPILALTALGAVVRLRMVGGPPQQTLMPLVGGMVAAVVIWSVFGGKRIDWLRKAGIPAVIAALGTVAVMLVFGHRYRGGIYLFGMNPSEVLKPLAVLFAASVLSAAKEEDRMLNLADLLKLAVGIGAIAGGMVMLRDYGMLAQLALTVSAMVFVASWWWGLVSFGVMGGAVMWFYLNPMGHMARRIAIWRDPFADPTGAGWQTLNGISAMLAGGMFGEGLGRGAVNAIPIASSDFVYAALAEELGFVGCCAMIALFMWLFLRGFVGAGRAVSPFASILAGGLVLSIAVQTLLNLAGVVNALPMTGITLPLISHGGSSLIVVLASLGLLLAASGARED